MRPFRSVGTVLSSLIIVSALATVACRQKPENAAAGPKKFEPNPTRLERGRYLTEGPMHCFVCHSEADKNLVPLPGGKGAGKKMFPEGEFPFTVRAPNITPDPETGAGKWTDEQIVRALRDGIGHDGRVLFPLMPYRYFRSLTDEDLASVVVYIRSLPAVRNEIPKPYIPDEARKRFVAIEPMKGSATEPDWKDPAKRGEYYATLSTCEGCHTPGEIGAPPIPGMRFGGGVTFEVWGVTSANITPSPSGISYYDEKMFLEVIRSGHVKARELKPIMLWRSFRNMNDEDLKAIYAYLRTVAPVQHRVDNTEPPTPCKLCKGKHGAGDRNDAFVAKVEK